jgi:hypothetical protein
MTKIVLPQQVHSMGAHLPVKNRYVNQQSPLILKKQEQISSDDSVKQQISPDVQEKLRQISKKFLESRSEKISSNTKAHSLKSSSPKNPPREGEKFIASQPKNSSQKALLPSTFTPKPQTVMAKTNYDPKGMSLDEPYIQVLKVPHDILINRIPNNYSLDDYHQSRKKVMSGAFKKIIKPMNQLLKENINRLTFDQKSKWDKYYDNKGDFGSLQAHLKVMMDRGDSQSIDDIDKLKDIINRMVPVRETQENKEALLKFNDLIATLDRWYGDKINHPAILVDRIRVNIRDLAKKISDKDSELKKEYVEGAVTKKREDLKRVNTDPDKSKHIPEDAIKRNLAHTRKQANKQYEKTFVKEIPVMGASLKSILNTLQDPPEFLKGKLLQEFLRDTMKDFEKKYQGIRYADKIFMKEFDKSGIEHQLYDKVLGPLGYDQYSMTNTNILSPTNEMPADQKMSSMMKFIMDGYGYQQMIDMFRQYVSAFADYQNLAIDMAKLGSGRQVQEIERMERARINVADQRDTAQTLKKYNMALHGAYAAHLENENDLLTMNADKRIRYLQMFKNRMDNLTKDRLARLESNKMALDNAGRLRDAKAKIVAAGYDLMNLTNMGAQSIMASMQRGYAQSEAFREQNVNMFQQMELERQRNVWKRIQDIIKMMRV